MRALSLTCRRLAIHLVAASRHPPASEIEHGSLAGAAQAAASRVTPRPRSARIKSGGSCENAPAGFIALVWPLYGITVLRFRSYYRGMDATTGPRYLGIQGRGTIALPADVRRRLHLDEPGAQLEMIEREDGVLELRAALPVPADQRWFWTERWQEREREVDEHVEAGRVTTHESTKDFLDHLNHLDRG